MQKNEILLSFGTEYLNMTKRLLEKADLLGDIQNTVSERKPEKKFEDITIGLKPNLVNPTPSEFGATTHPEIAAGIIEYLKERGIQDILIMEGSWVGDSTEDAFEYCGYNKIKEQYDITLIDTQKDGYFEKECSGEILKICNCVQTIDYLINIPVLKGHCQTKATCALKNLKGLIPNEEKRRFHAKGLNRPIALLNQAIQQDFIVVDNICGDPVFEDGGHPLVRNCIMAAKDPVLTDAYGAELLGIRKEEIGYLVLSNESGVGNWDTHKAEINVIEGDAPASRMQFSRPIDTSYAMQEIDCCSACYSNLAGALERLEEDGLLQQLKCRISIGQGWKEKKGVLGIGNCTAGFRYCIKGCPPSEEDIYEFIKSYIKKTGECRCK